MGKNRPYTIEEKGTDILESGTPTYGCKLSQSVKNVFLVDFLSVERKLSFIENGVVCDELSDEDRAAWRRRSRASPSGWTSGL